MLMCFVQVASFLCDGIVESMQTYMNITAPGLLVLLSLAYWQIGDDNIETASVCVVNDKS